MTRPEGIQYVIDIAHGAHTEFCSSKDKCKDECRTALLAIGASQTELDAANWWGQW